MKHEGIISAAIVAANLILSILMYQTVGWYFIRGYNEVVTFLVIPLCACSSGLNLLIAAAIAFVQRRRRTHDGRMIVLSLCLSGVIVALSLLFAPIIGSAAIAASCIYAAASLMFLPQFSLRWQLCTSMPRTHHLRQFEPARRIKQFPPLLSSGTLRPLAQDGASIEFFRRTSIDDRPLMQKRYPTEASDTTLDAETLKKLIREAFADVEKPPHWAISRSNEGDEPRALADEFASVPDWDSLDATFLDRTPKGLSSALSFFSDEAFRYYLPAYLIADINGLLETADPVFHLCYGLDDRGDELVNPRRYGNRTFRDEANHRLAVFSRRHAEAIVAYLRNRLDADDFNAPMIQSALDNFWIARFEDG